MKRQVEIKKNNSRESFSCKVKAVICLCFNFCIQILNSFIHLSNLFELCFLFRVNSFLLLHNYNKTLNIIRHYLYQPTIKWTYNKKHFANVCFTIFRLHAKKNLAPFFIWSYHHAIKFLEDICHFLWFVNKGKKWQELHVAKWTKRGEGGKSAKNSSFFWRNFLHSFGPLWH